MTQNTDYEEIVALPLEMAKTILRPRVVMMPLSGSIDASWNSHFRTNTVRAVQGADDCSGVLCQDCDIFLKPPNNEKPNVLGVRNGRIT